MTLLVSHTFLAVVLFVTAWCRIIKTSDHRTKPSIRTAMSFTAMASVVIGSAPWGSRLWAWFPSYEPHFVAVMLLGAFCAVQISTARHWRFGVPASFQKRGHA